MSGYILNQNEERRSWLKWVAVFCLTSAQTLLIIAVFLSTCHSPEQPKTPESSIIVTAAPPEHLTGDRTSFNLTRGDQSPLTFIDTTETAENVTTLSEPAMVDVVSTTIQSIHMSSYLEKRERQVYGLGYNFSASGDKICQDGEAIFLVILCTTKHYQKAKRDTIRNTWGKISKSKMWPRLIRQFNGIKLVFITGQPPGHSSKYDTAIQDEYKEFGDIVQADFVDNVKNASLKILLGLKWIHENCPNTQFVLRVGDDQFVHVANLVRYLEIIKVPENGCIIGRNVSTTTVARQGRWGLSTILYPYDNYPPYVYKSAYAISGNILGELISTAQHLPYIFIEDVYITGILRSSLATSLIQNTGFSKGPDPRPKLCGFHNDFRISSNSIPSLTQNLWKSLHRNLKNCYNLPEQK